MKSGGVLGSQFIAQCSYGLREIVFYHRRRTQIVYSLPALDDGPITHFQSFFECVPCFARRKLVDSYMKVEHQSLKTLQQRVVQLAGDARALADPLFQAHVELPPDAPEVEVVSICQGQQDQDNPDSPEPPATPPRLQYHEGYSCTLFIPHIAAVAALHPENVLAWRERIGDGSPVALRLIPLRLQRLQPVTVAIPFRAGVAKRRKFESQDILRVGKSRLQGRLFAENLKIGDHHGRNRWIVNDIAREKCRQPAIGAKKHLPAWTLNAGAVVVELVTGKAVGNVVSPKGLLARIESRQAIVGAYP